jgi:hypothetical protein
MRVVPGRWALSAATIPGIASAADRSSPCPGASGVPRHEAFLRSRSAQRDQDVNVQRGAAGLSVGRCRVRPPGSPALPEWQAVSRPYPLARWAHGTPRRPGRPCGRGQLTWGEGFGEARRHLRKQAKKRPEKDDERREVPALAGFGWIQASGPRRCFGCVGQSVWSGQIRVAVIAMPRFVVPYCWISASSSRIR